METRSTLVQKKSHDNGNQDIDARSHGAEGFDIRLNLRDLLKALEIRGNTTHDRVDNQLSDGKNGDGDRQDNAVLAESVDPIREPELDRASNERVHERHANKCPWQGPQKPWVVVMRDSDLIERMANEDLVEKIAEKHEADLGK